MRPHLKNRPHALYRFYDASDVLLYIGLTVNLGPRCQAHRSDKPWWCEVIRITVEHFADRPSVEIAEKRAIKTEKPRYNVAHKPKKPSRTPPPRPMAAPVPAPPMVRDWISGAVAAKILNVSPWQIRRSLLDETERTRQWGDWGVGWRRKPLVKRRMFQVSRSYAEALAQRTKELAAGTTDRGEPPPV